MFANNHSSKTCHFFIRTLTFPQKSFELDEPIDHPWSSVSFSGQIVGSHSWQRTWTLINYGMQQQPAEKNDVNYFDNILLLLKFWLLKRKIFIIQISRYKLHVKTRLPVSSLSDTLLSILFTGQIVWSFLLTFQN